MNEVEQAFETFVEELQAQLSAAEVTGAVSDQDREELRELIETRRSQLRAAGDEAEARRILEAFKRESARFGQGAAMP